MKNLKLAAAVAAFLVSIGTGWAAQPPSIILLLADDLGYADTGPTGCRDIPTPNLDRLAAEGVVCTSGYSSHPYCSPMRAALMAVRYQHRFGYERNIAYDPQNNHMGLPGSEVTVAQRLRRVGYRTGAFGKWHLGAAHSFAPNNRGFDFFFGFRGGGHDYFTVDMNRPMGEGYQQPLERNGKPADIEGYLTTRLADEAIGFIEREAGKPFFIYLSFNAPHTPLQAPEDLLARFASIPEGKRRTYAAMVFALDEAIGRVLSALNRLGLRQNTAVFFLSDNGGPENANGSDNGPLRGQKGEVYEGGIRVPFIVSWPGKLPAGTRFDQPVMSFDLTRTALEIAGAPTEAPIEGVNLVPFLDGSRSEPPHEALFWRMEAGLDWAVRSGNLKLLKTQHIDSPALYDLATDLGETRDLAAERPDDVSRLRALYRVWDRDNRPPFFPGFREYHPIMQEKYLEVSAP